MTATRAPYCGEPPMRAARLVRRDSEGGFPALFADRRVFWSYNTRVAIRAACDLLGLAPGDEVLAPAYNCGSEVDPLVDAGLAVRLYPVEEDLRADPARIAPLITGRTRAIYVTHYFGMIQPELAALRALCDDRGLRLIEDCALSLLSGERPAEGHSGDVSVFCFHKFVPVLQGGALVLNAPDLAAKTPFPRPAPRKAVARMLERAGLANVLGPARAQGLMRALRGAPPADAPAGAGALDDMPAHYYFDPALRGRRISAFAARPLRAFSVRDAIAVRRANWAHYRDLLDGMAGVRMLMPDLAPETCPLNMPVMVEGRDRVARMLQAEGIGVTPWWAGFNRNLDWQGQTGAMALKNHVLSLPLHQFLGPAHLDHIADRLRHALTAR
jgi:perosamine synthetase